MRAQSWILIIIALGCGLVASIGISQVMDRGDATAGPEQQYESIFIAITDIPTGNTITPQMIKLEKWPKDKLPEGVITQLENVEKRRPRSAIIKGEPILEGKLINANEKGAIDQLTPGYQAVAIKVTAEDISGGLVKPGDRVNVLVYLQKGDEIPETAIKTLLRSIRVFAIDSEVEREENESKVVQAKTVTLELTERDAAIVTLAQQKGKIRLTLRKPGDANEKKEEAEEGDVTLEDLLNGGKKKPVAETKPAAAPTVDPNGLPVPTANEIIVNLTRGGTGGDVPAVEKPRRMVVGHGATRQVFEFPGDGSEPIEVTGQSSSTQATPPVTPDTLPEHGTTSTNGPTGDFESEN